MRDNDKISILMPVYKEPINFIKESLNSIKHQTYDNIEILVGVDDPTNREAIDFLNSISNENNKIKIFVNEHNIGLAENLNGLLNQAKGKYVARMDADDVADSSRLEKQLEFLNYYHLDFVSGAYDSIDENGYTTKVAKKKNLLNKDVRIIEKYGNILTHPLWLVSKDIMLNLKYRRVEPVEDYDLIARAILDNNIKFGFMGQSLLKYRVRNKSESHKNPAQSLLMTNYISNSIKRKLFPNISILNNLKKLNVGYSKYLKLCRMTHLLRYKIVSLYINNKVNKIEQANNK
ncbi:glycosyltransferase [Leuconostoc mesenteroides]|uniref:glycosyltransferase n=1 Tax=Leuconostoc mesenteroides TaxID=1245 RepID=UPI000775CC17|nr:glycosyltransferase [Leuconostoc mesenteroides]MBZ1507510.1 glycosyltransferase [Leuconostoc mesenteroides]MCM6827455.1 glycosyltransferase [Leuconostoc mesenteroides]